MARKTLDALSNPLAAVEAAHKKAMDDYEAYWQEMSSWSDDSTESGWAPHVTPQLLAEADRNLTRLLTVWFRATDALDRARRKKDAPPDPVFVEIEDVRAVVIASLSDKLDEINFSVNSGLLGSKIANAILSEISEDESGDAPLCGDCRDG